MWRQESGDPLINKLTYLRKNRPTGAEGAAFVRDLCRGHKAWSGHHEPRRHDIAALLERTGGDTTVITCTRKGAALVNDLCSDVLFGEGEAVALGKVAADYESNPGNYDENGALKEVLPEPLPLVLYAGLRVRLTRNMDKSHDFVNGMAAVVQSFDARKRTLVVETETQQLLCVYPVTTEDVPGGRLTFYPIKLGYADTVHKFQGGRVAARLAGQSWLSGGRIRGALTCSQRCRLSLGRHHQR